MKGNFDNRKHSGESPVRRMRLKLAGWRSTIVVLGIVIVILLLSSVASGAVFTAPTRISRDESQNYESHIVLDANGHAHVAWSALDTAGIEQVYYRDNASGSWGEIEQVSYGPGMQSYVQIALDADGYSHITWAGRDGPDPAPGQDPGVFQIWYAENTSGVWVVTQITSGGTVGVNDRNSPQVAIDANGYSHITWNGGDGNATQIYYADNSKGDWTDICKITSAGAGYNQGGPQIGIDPGGYTHLVWSRDDDPSNSYLFQISCADNTGGTWVVNPLTAGGTNSRSGPRLALDSSGYSHVIWTEYTNAYTYIYYADNTQGWVTSYLFQGGNAELAVDANGHSHLAFSNSDNILYADNVNGWPASPTVVAPETSTLEYNSARIAVDQKGYSHLAITGYEVSDLYLYYTDNTSGSWPASPALISEPGMTSNTYQHIAVDETGRSHIAWSGYPDPSPTGIYYMSAIPPTITGLDPATGLNNNSSLEVKVNGSNFQEGATLILTGPDTIGPVKTTGSGGSVNATLDLKGKAPGSYKATITNPDQIAASHDDAFSVGDAPPEPQPVTTYYLAEGTNAWGFNTYITIENPGSEPVHARLTYMDPNASASGSGVIKTRTVTLPPLSQTTVSSREDIGDVDFSTKVECAEGRPIAVDRTMFWTGENPELHGYHASMGTASASKIWYLPEGSSNWGFETWTLVLNPNDSPANITLSYMTTGSGEKTLNKVIPPNSRATWSMLSDIGGADASIKVQADQPVVAERSMYRGNRREGSCSIGAATPANDFFLAEGAVGYGAGFKTWVLVQNPNNDKNEVTLTYQTNSGTLEGPTFIMEPNSRKNILLNESIPADTDVSTLVHGSKPLVAERAMYWNSPMGEAFHSSIGLSEPHLVFMLPEGQNDSNIQTWTLVANPNPGAVEVKVSYLPQGGGEVKTFTDEIPANSRRSYNMADKITGRASIIVESLDGVRPVIVERAVYGTDWGWGTDTIGAYQD